MFFNKYGNKKNIVDGIKFDSQKEANRYLILKDMLICGEIKDLKLQPKFLLQDSFTYKGKTENKLII